jgi:hypothetical protein
MRVSKRPDRARLLHRHRLEVFGEVAAGGRTLPWFEGRTARDRDVAKARGAATKYLLHRRLIEPSSRGLPFKLTAKGRKFRNQLGRRITWSKADEIKFP